MKYNNGLISNFLAQSALLVALCALAFTGSVNGIGNALIGVSIAAVSVSLTATGAKFFSSANA